MTKLKKYMSLLEYNYKNTTVSTSRKRGKHGSSLLDSDIAYFDHFFRKNSEVVLKSSIARTVVQFLVPC